MRTVRAVPLAVVALLALGALTGCTSASSGGSTAAGSAVDLQAGDGRMPAAAGSASGSGSEDGAAETADRAIVTTARLRLVAKDPIDVADRITALVAAAGGRVATSTEDPAADRASASLTLRIPATAFAATMRRIESQGDVRESTVDATDVTARVTDYTVRIANLRTSIARLQTLLSTATSSSALVELEGALTDRQTNLEQLLAQQRTLTDQVSYGTLEVSVVVPAAAPKAGPADFLSGIATGWQSLVAAIAATAIGVGVVLPWAGLLAAITAVGLLVRRAVKRRATTA